MKLNMKSQRKQTHNTVLTESGVFGLLCINFQKERVSITIDQKGPALFFLLISYLYKLLHARISIVPGVFSVTKRRFMRFNSLSLSSFGQMEHLPFFKLRVLKIEQADTCHYLVPENCPFACCVQVTHLSTNWVINLEGSAWLFASKV
jgi:hypothetical protein